MSRFTSILLVSPLADSQTWGLMREFGYDVGAEGSQDQITVPVGFETDVESVPRSFWAILPKWGNYGNAAVIHDWLYWEQGRPRPAADAVTLEGMAVFGVSAVVRQTIYTAVRLPVHPAALEVADLEAGKLADAVTGQVTGQVQRLLAVCNGEFSRAELQEKLGLRHRDNFIEAYLQPALNAGLLEMTIPDKPRSSKQKYRLTEKGRAVVVSAERRES